MRVLIVEGDANLGSSLQHSLLMLGHEPVLAATAEAARRRLEHEPPDGLLLAARVAGRGVADLLALPPVREAGVPVVVMAEPSEMAEARALGALDVLERPVTLERLTRALQAMERRARRGVRATGAPPGAERRRAPRAALVVPVTVVDGAGRRRSTMSMNLSTYGIKLAPTTPLDDVNVVELVFTPPDGGDALTVVGVLVREDRDGYAFSFVDLADAQVARLAALVERLTR